ncbi:hypothetical protein COOONC_14359 [Cooperia oncophora]
MSLNLYTPANGLHRTHVTWEDIEEDMQRELDTVASFGPNKTAKDIGDGNVSSNERMPMRCNQLHMAIVPERQLLGAELYFMKSFSVA